MWIYLRMAPRVMLLDMLKFRGIPESRNIPVQMSHPLMQIGISTPDILDIALEVLYIDGVEANNGWVKPNIDFRKFLTEDIRAI